MTAGRTPLSQAIDSTPLIPEPKCLRSARGSRTLAGKRFRKFCRLLRKRDSAGRIPYGGVVPPGESVNKLPFPRCCYVTRPTMHMPLWLHFTLLMAGMVK